MGATAATGDDAKVHVCVHVPVGGTAALADGARTAVAWEVGDVTEWELVAVDEEELDSLVSRNALPEGPVAEKVCSRD